MEQFTLPILAEIDKFSHREVYVKIERWDAFDEAQHRSTIQGRTTSGSVSVNGKSASRRTCALTLACDQIGKEVDEWQNIGTSLSNRIQIYIGLKNLAYPGTDYETNNSQIPNVTYDKDSDIFWYNQGVFVCTSYQVNRSANSMNISIQGSDLMCLFDGTISGTLDSNVDFGTFEQTDEDGNIITVDIPVHEIITESVYHYGQVPKDKIEIKDLPKYGYSLKEYRYDEPMYLFRKTDSLQYILGSLNPKLQVLSGKENKDISKVDFIRGLETELEYNDTDYKVQQINFGQVAGYAQTPLTYPGELIGKPGETIYSILNKIANAFGDYEFFFDINGKFIFQKRNTQYIYKGQKREAYSLKAPITYIYKPDGNYTEAQNPLRRGMQFDGWQFLNSSRQIKVTSEALIFYKGNGANNSLALKLNSTDVQSLEAITIGYHPGYTPRTLTVSICDATSENILSIQGGNFSICKNIGSINGANPMLGITGVDNFQSKNSIILVFSSNEGGNAFIRSISIKYKDSEQEIAYEFPNDLVMFTQSNASYSLRDIRNDFSIWGKRKSVAGAQIDIHARFALQKKPKKYSTLTDEKKEAAKAEFLEKYGIELKAKGGQNCAEGTDWREIIYQMALDYDAFNHTDIYQNSDARIQAAPYQPYFTDMLGFWRQLYNPDKQDETDEDLNITYDNNGWNVDIATAPEKLNFWIDFFDIQDKGNMYEQYSIEKIGRRPKVLNNGAISAIQYNPVPSIIFYHTNIPELTENSGYYSFRVNEPVEKMFATSTRGLSTFDIIETAKIDYLDCTENRTVTSVPIYHLEPNSIVVIDGEEYLLTNFSIPLTYNGTSSLTLTKIKGGVPAIEILATVGGK